MEGMRPGFPPRYEGPDSPYFNRMPFDDHHPRHRRHDERRRFSREDNPEIQEKPDRRSRWSSGSPSRSEDARKSETKDEVIIEEVKEETREDLEPPGVTEVEQITEEPKEEPRVEEPIPESQTESEPV